MTRLKKIANQEEDDDDMSFDEIKEETIISIKNMANRTNEWAVRDTLLQFTDWGFYRGDSMAIVDPEMAKDVCKQLLDYVESISERDANLLYEIYEKVYHYSF